MKIQDIAFIAGLSFLLLIRRPRWLLFSGIIAILLSMPLFQMEIALFTAQRLIMYAAGFLFAVLLTFVFHTNKQ
jgi:hypothetical protein